MKQYEAVIQTIEKLGGVATLGQLNQEVFKIEACKWETKTPFASIRRIVQTTKGIYKIKPGLYGLEKMRHINEENGFMVETDKNRDSKAYLLFTHTYYQGLLLEVGNLRGLGTYSPHHDKNHRFSDGRRLSEISSLGGLPSFSYPHMVKRCSTVDVVWINGRGMPDSLFEVEHSTDIQNSLLKYSDLQDFNARMVIVADKRRKEEYLQKIRCSAFGAISQRVHFLDYESLNAQYMQELAKKDFSFNL